MSDQKLNTHTPGPWSIFRDNERNNSVAYVRTAGSNWGESEVCTSYGEQNQAANLSLIAAAPKLLETLERINDALTEKEFHHFMDDGIDIIEVIKLARGES